MRISFCLVGLLALTAFVPVAKGRADHFTLPVYSELPLGSIKPRGWLKDQLETMLRGSSGHLDEVYAKLRDDNGWLGGKGDGWEETPYWLDGALPLAYLLDDPVLKAKVRSYVDWTLEHQRPSGYFGPITVSERAGGPPISVATAADGDDWWPKMLMLKVLMQYYSATHDPRVLPFMTRYFHYQLETLQKTPLAHWSEWAQSRGSENILCVQWLYSLTHDVSLLGLAGLLNRQSFSWSRWLGDRDWVIGAAAQQNNDDWMHRHGVNVAMALKEPALDYERTRDSNYLRDLRTGWHDLMRLHGLPNGMFSADEDLHGNLPTQGTELCAIVEAMFSMEEIIGITGDVTYMDALERIAFNALPAQTTDDYNDKQYFQIPNQVEIARGVFDFSLPFDRGMNNVLGMRSGYTCCLANMHQGWTKYVEHCWYKTADGGIAALEYGPTELSTTVGAGHQPITVTENTSYPFSGDIQFLMSMHGRRQFSFGLRIPSWCGNATILLNGRVLQRVNGGRVVTLEREWQDKDELTLQLPMTVTTSNWARNSRAVERGPLVYALKLGEQWVKGTDKVEGDYYSVFPTGPWNFGLLRKIVDDPRDNLGVTVDSLPRPWVWNEAHAPITINAAGKRLPGWTLTDGVAYQPVTDRGGIYKGVVSDTVQALQLIPYGCTKVRIVAFPVVK